MTSIEELRNERIEKKSMIESAGHDPYPISSDRTHSLAKAKISFDEISQKGEEIVLAGRVLSMREHGSVVFLDIYDGSDELQIVCKEDLIKPESEYELLQNALDIGDFIEVKGALDTTRTGQQSLFAVSWRMLSKSLRPIPTQWDGLEDTETRLRKRYLDILMNEETRDLVQKRAKFFSAIRSFMEEADFMEVQTPIIEAVPGGADARPFKSYHNALDMDVYLRISAGELWQKRLLVAGFEKVFEVGRVFRNEGISAEHAQDYMQMEFYWAYADHEDGMEFVKEMYRHVAEQVISSQKFSTRGFEVDLSSEWKEYDYSETIKEITNVDIATVKIDTLKDKLEELNIAIDERKENRIRMIDLLWKHCRKQLCGPGFLVNVPKELSPLAKGNPKKSNAVAQFQPIIAGSELGKGYSELNNPKDQSDRFQKQQQLRDEGDDEAQRFDEDFVESLEYGMPPACGFGVSERFFAFLTNTTIRESQIFPLLKNKSE